MTRNATLTIADGVRVVVPDSIGLITPYVLFEQQDWFEDEIKFLRRLLKPGEKVIDIGANYGVYTLAAAKLVGPTGAVWAFEPASSTADFLMQGVAANQFLHVTVERSALSSTIGHAQLKVGDHAELNALQHGDEQSSGTEKVRIVTLDDAMRRHGWTEIDFLKIDAEGEEQAIIEGGLEFLTECSPLILYEIKAGDSLHLELVQRFLSLGYTSYRLVPGLNVLIPFDVDETADPYLLNLFCCKPDRAALLEARGLLVNQSPSSAEPPRGPGWERTLAALPYSALLLNSWRSSPRDAKRDLVEQALDAYCVSRDGAASPADRLVALRTAFQMLTDLTKDARYLRCVSFARVAAEYGARGQALTALTDFVRRRNAGNSPDFGEPFLAASRRFDTIAPGAELAPWLSASILETIEKLVAFSSFYTGQSALPRLQALESSAFASDEIRRRLQLIRLRFGNSS